MNEPNLRLIALTKTEETVDAIVKLAKSESWAITLLPMISKAWETLAQESRDENLKL